MRLLSTLTLCLQLASASIFINYKGGEPTSDMGSCQLEGAFLGDKINCPGNSSIFIKPEVDPEGRKCLHYHRDPTFRRAEVEGNGNYSAEKHYYIGYEFMLSNTHKHLAIFQWKKDNKTAAPVVDIPFNLQFSDHAILSLGYTPPAGKYYYLWTSSKNFTVNTTHFIYMDFTTSTAKNSSSIRLVVDDEYFYMEGIDLWTGYTYTKFGLYRGELGDHPEDPGSNYFDSYVYRVVVVEGGLRELGQAVDWTGPLRKCKRDILGRNRGNCHW